MTKNFENFLVFRTKQGPVFKTEYGGQETWCSHCRMSPKSLECGSGQQPADANSSIVLYCTVHASCLENKHIARSIVVAVTVDTCQTCHVSGSETLAPPGFDTSDHDDAGRSHGTGLLSCLNSDGSQFRHAICSFHWANRLGASVSGRREERVVGTSTAACTWPCTEPG